MDEETAYRLFEAGQPVDLTINSRREDGALITGLEIPSGFMNLLLRTPIGEPDRRARVPFRSVEVAPKT